MGGKCLVVLGYNCGTSGSMTRDLDSHSLWAAPGGLTTQVLLVAHGHPRVAIQ